MKAFPATSFWRWVIPGSAIALTLCAAPLLAQGSRADYERSAGLRTATANKVFRSRVEPRWLPGGTRFWYENKTGAATHEFVLVDAERGTRRVAFDHARLASALKTAGVATAAPDRLALRDLAWEDADALAFTLDGQRWRIALVDYSVIEKKPAPPAATAALAPADAPAASRRTGPETSLSFHNRSAGRVELFWLDPDGNRRSYGTLGAGESREMHTFAGHVWLVVDELGRSLAAFEAADKPGDADIPATTPARTRPATTREPERPTTRDQSPDGRWRVALKAHNLVLRDAVNGAESPLTADGTAAHPYRERVSWSPDSRKFVALRVEPGQEHKVSFVESSPRDQVQPKLVTFDYYKPGDRLPHPRPTLVDVATKKAIAIDDTLFPSPYTTNGNLDPRR